MGYFDALTSSAFKTTPDGRRLFFPWGALGRGYEIGPEQDYETLRRRIKLWTIVGLVLILAASQVLGFLAGFIAAAAMIAFYFGWMRYVLRSLRPSAERLTVRESMIAQARAQSPRRCGHLLILSIAFVVASVFILIVHPCQMASGDRRDGIFRRLRGRLRVHAGPAPAELATDRPRTSRPSLQRSWPAIFDRTTASAAPAALRSWSG